jgi:hypothetical protein
MTLYVPVSALALFCLKWKIKKQTQMTNSANIMCLTKREYFAAKALQGIIANKDGLDIKIERIVESAVDTADALIEELNKTK